MIRFSRDSRFMRRNWNRTVSVLQDLFRHTIDKRCNSSHTSNLHSHTANLTSAGRSDSAEEQESSFNI